MIEVGYAHSAYLIKNEIISKLKDDFLVYLKESISVQKNTNRDIDTLLQKTKIK